MKCAANIRERKRKHPCADGTEATSASTGEGGGVHQWLLLMAACLRAQLLLHLQLWRWFWKSREVRLLLFRRPLQKKKLWPWVGVNQWSGPAPETPALVSRTLRQLVMGITGPECCVGGINPVLSIWHLQFCIINQFRYSEMNRNMLRI